jgi:hypothetical protein
MTIEDKLQEILLELKAISKALGTTTTDFSKTREEIECPKLIPARRWAKYQKIPTQGAINGLLLDRKDNGFDKCVVRISGRLYIDRDLYAQWVQDQKESKKNPDYRMKNVKK